MNPRSFGTHSRSFHADEVTACAILLYYNEIDHDKIVRTRDLAVLAQCETVCDVGNVYDPKRRRFDHHQSDYTGRFSSAGMVWRDLYDRHKITTEQYEWFCATLIDGVDAHDTGTNVEGVCTYSNLIANFAPLSYEPTEEEGNAAFHTAVAFALDHITRFHQRYAHNLQYETAVAEAMKTQKTHLFFDQSIPWMDAFFKLGGERHPALFVIMPTKHHWKLRVIPPTIKRRMEMRVPLPASWSGLVDAELATASGIPGALFCHKNLFTSVWTTREDALRALDLALRFDEV